MSITKTWEVNTMERDLSDGHVNKVIYRVKGIDDSDSTEKDRATGEVVFTKPDSLPSDFKAYDSLDEATVISWVKDSLGTTLIAEWEDAVVVTTEWGKPF